MDVQQIYAEVVGGLSALTAILLVIPYFLRFAVAWVWNLILFILWMALFGIFAKVLSPPMHSSAFSNCETDIALRNQMYLNEKPEGNGDIQRMKNALWVVLANAILWLITTVAGFVYWWRHRDRVSRFTGRAKV